MQLNEQAPDFELADLQNTPHRLHDYRGKIVVLNFWSAECPHSARTDRHLQDLLEPWQNRVVILPIASNQNESLQMLQEAAQERGMQTILVDSEQVVADLYEAQTTPHVFVIDQKGTLCYRGAVDDITFRQRRARRFFLREALEALLEGRQPELGETLAYGCTIVREI